MFDLSQMQKMQSEMQQRLEEAQGQLKDEKVTGSSGGGAVTVTCDGNQEIVSVKIAEGVVDVDDEELEMLQDLFIAAANQAIENSKEKSQAKLGNLTGESSSLAVFRNGQVIIAAKQEQDGPLRVVQRIGESRPVHCTAVGKVLAAAMSDEELEETIERTDFQQKTPRTITSPAVFRREMAHIRKRGIAFDNEEHIKGVRCVAVPVKDYTGKTRAALCVVGPKDNLSPERMNKLQRDLLNVAASLSERLGYKTRE